MQIFASFINILTSRPAAITVLFFYAMDNLFGTVTFDCPCTLPAELRIYFAKVLLVCPALIIFCIDVPWNLLFSIINARRSCCCQEACGGALMALLTPIGFSVAWIFIFQESAQFSECINATNNINQTGCIVDTQSTEYKIRTCSVVLLCLITSALCLRVIILCLAPFCKSRFICCCTSLCCSCKKPFCESCCKSPRKSCCTSLWRSLKKPFCESCCDCLTIHPDSVLLKENLSFSTLLELQREHFLIEDEFFKGYPVGAIDNLNIGQGQKIRLKKYINSPRIKDLKPRWNQQNGQLEKSTAKLTGLMCNRRYYIQMWVIQKCCLCISKKESFCSIEICTTESEGQKRILLKNSNGTRPNRAVSGNSNTTTDESQNIHMSGNSNTTTDESQNIHISKFSKIVVTHDSVSLEWNLEESDQRTFIGYELQYKIVKNLNHVDMQQSTTEMSPEFSSLQADVLYRSKIWAENGNTNEENFSIETGEEGSGSSPTRDNELIREEPEIHKKLLCDKCAEEFHPENEQLNGSNPTIQILDPSNAVALEKEMLDGVVCTAEQEEKKKKEQEEKKKKEQEEKKKKEQEEKKKKEQEEKKKKEQEEKKKKEQEEKENKQSKQRSNMEEERTPLTSNESIRKCSIV